MPTQESDDSRLQRLGLQGGLQKLQLDLVRRNDGRSNDQPVGNREQQETREPNQAISPQDKVERESVPPEEPATKGMEGTGGRRRRNECISQLHASAFVEAMDGRTEGSIGITDTTSAETTDHEPPSTKRSPAAQPGEICWREAFRLRLEEAQEMPAATRRQIVSTLKQTEQLWTDLHEVLTARDDTAESQFDETCIG